MRTFALSTTDEPNAGGDDDGVVILGHRLSEGEPVFGLHPRDRRQHVFVLGQTGAGKTTLLRNMLIHDLHEGRGCALIDPHGDLARDLLDHFPPNRAKDLVYFDPADPRHAPALNPFDGVPQPDRHRVASALVAAFRGLWRESWGPRLEYILHNAVAALLDCQDVSLLALPRMLSDDAFREWVVRQIKDPLVLAYWRDEFTAYDLRFRREVVAPIQNKVGQLLFGPLATVLGQARNRIDFRYLIDHRRIFIANLAKGRLGEDKSNLLGSLLVTQFQQAALTRADVPEQDRVPFHLVIDEVGSFSTDAFASVLSESRKYGLAMVLAAQYLAQMREEVIDAVFGNCGSFIAFRSGHGDAEILSREFGGHYDTSLFSSLGNGQVVVKLLRDGRYGDAFLGRTLPPLSMHYGRAERLIRRSRERYTVPRHVVDERIRRWMRRRYD